MTLAAGDEVIPSKFRSCHRFRQKMGLHKLAVVSRELTEPVRHIAAMESRSKTRQMWEGSAARQVQALSASANGQFAAFGVKPDARQPRDFPRRGLAKLWPAFNLPAHVGQLFE
jgi:hypothetical protein